MAGQQGVRVIGPALLALGLMMVGPSGVVAEDMRGDVNFFVGYKSLDEDDWEPVEDQVELGAEITWGKETWPFHISTDILYSYGSEIFIDGETVELDLGIRKLWKKGSARPYLGGGLAVLYARSQEVFFAVDEDDQAAGAWIGGGVFWRKGNRFNIGASLRYSTGEVTIANRDVEAGGVHLGLLLGWSWPANR